MITQEQIGRLKLLATERKRAAGVHSSSTMRDKVLADADALRAAVDTLEKLPKISGGNHVAPNDPCWVLIHAGCADGKDMQDHLEVRKAVIDFVGCNAINGKPTEHEFSVHVSKFYGGFSEPDETFATEAEAQAALSAKGK